MIIVDYSIFDSSQ